MQYLKGSKRFKPGVIGELFMGFHPTIKDVAKKAGVSITTVSFVLNRRADVVISEEVKKRVLNVALEMDYHPSAMAAGLAGRRTHNIGLVFYQEDNIISNPFYSYVIEGMLKATLEKNFNLLFSYVDPTYKGFQNLPKIIREKNVDGVLLIGRIEPIMVKDIKDRQIPIVAVNNYPDLNDIDTIQMFNQQAGILATEYLIQLGHQHIGFLTLTGNRPGLEERKEGWKVAISKYSQIVEKDYLFNCEALDFQAGYEKTKEILDKNKKITGLICVSDELAAGAIQAAHEVGRRVPSDLSIVGFGDIPISRITDPPLTTVCADKENMGKWAVTRIMELIEKKDLPPIRREVPVELIVRQSTGKP